MVFNVIVTKTAIVISLLVLQLVKEFYKTMCVIIKDTISQSLIGDIQIIYKTDYIKGGRTNKRVREAPHRATRHNLWFIAFVSWEKAALLECQKISSILSFFSCIPALCLDTESIVFLSLFKRRREGYREAGKRNKRTWDVPIHSKFDLFI